MTDTPPPSAPRLHGRRLHGLNPKPSVRPHHAFMVDADHGGAVRQVAEKHHVAVVAPEDGLLLDLGVLNLCFIGSLMGFREEVTV